MTYIVLQRAGAGGGWDTHKTGDISKGRGTAQRKTAGEAPPPRRALRGGAGRGPRPRRRGCHSPPRLRRGGCSAPAQPLANERVCARQPARLGVRSAGEAPATAVAERGCFSGRGVGRGGRGEGGHVWGVSWSTSDGGCVPSPAVLPCRGEGGDGERGMQGGDGAGGRGSGGSRVGSAVGWPPRQPEAGSGE